MDLHFFAGSTRGKRVAINHVISFCHPAYPRTERDLLRFNALDGLGQDGFELDLTLISCGIVDRNTRKTRWLAASGDLEQFVRVESLQSS